MTPDKIPNYVPNESKGIDVSNYQGKIDWAKVKASGIQFVIIRAGWGKTNIDPKFRDYIKGASDAGLDIGIYWFLYAVTENDISGNAKKCQEVIEPYRSVINMRVWADWEYDSDTYHNKHAKALTKAQRTAWVKKFLEEMKGYGFQVGIYANPDYLKNKFNDVSEYPLWLAYYATSKGNYNPMMWQYSSSGRVDGITSKVDMDIFYGNAESTPAPPKERKYPVLGKGSTGEYTKLCQSLLKDWGCDCGEVDGIFGPKTLTAVKKFQSDKGLVVDGMVGPMTWGALLR